ncbi:MAG: sulfurtransferase TusA family protein [Deltaproteobacteria bacterium]|jgi:TusA-related sulfurtransferase|nr:sulfurtransferase TusA family protein [Deltaproteobacteria bacterium]
MEDFAIECHLDLTDEVCPMTFLKALAALDELRGGAVASFRLNAGESVANVPRTLKEEGHKTLKISDNGDGTFTLVVKRSLEDL